MHMPLVNCISIVTDLYNIHYDGYYLKYDEIAHRKEVNFCRGPILPIPAVLSTLE